jgi:hypothetical protein
LEAEAVRSQVLPTLHSDWTVSADARSMARAFKFPTTRALFAFVAALGNITVNGAVPRSSLLSSRHGLS